MYRPQITQIANILSTNYQRAKTPGLIKGYLGAAFFFYYYARYTGLYYYEDVANSLLDEVMRIDVKRMSKTFADGVYGVGWLIKRLVRENFLDEECGSLKLFEELSQQRYSEKEIYFEQMFEPSVASKLLLEPDVSPCIGQRLMDNLEIISNWKGRAKGATFWLSIIIHIIRNADFYDKHCVLQKYRQMFEHRLFQCIRVGHYTKQDMFIINYLQKEYSCFSEISSVLLDNQFNFLHDIYMNWQTVIFDDLIEIKEILPHADLNNYLNEINFHISENCISMDGICSLGINLIKKSKGMAAV